MPCPSRGRRGTCRTGPETAFDVGDDEAGDGDAHARYGQRPEGRRRDDAPPGYAGGRARHADARRCDARPARGAGGGARLPNAPTHIGPDVGRGARPARPPSLKTISVSPCLRALRVDRPEGAHGAGRRGRRPLPPFRPDARGVRSADGPARTGRAAEDVGPYHRSAPAREVSVRRMARRAMYPRRPRRGTSERAPTRPGTTSAPTRTAVAQERDPPKKLKTYN